MICEHSKNFLPFAGDFVKPSDIILPHAPLCFMSSCDTYYNRSLYKWNNQL